MTATDPDRVRALARLARLELDADEAARLAPELERILAAFAVLARHALATAGTADDDALASTAVIAVEARRRGDEPQPSLPRDALLAAAPEREGGFYAVPKTVGGER